MHRLWCLVAIGALAVAVSVVGTGPAFAAKGGNNDTAKVCQHGGWKALVPDAGGRFANQGDCVNDGAKGSAPFGTAGKAACDNITGATFALVNPTMWSCEFATLNKDEFDAIVQTLQAACDTDTMGASGFFFVSGAGGVGDVLCLQVTTATK